MKILKLTAFVVAASLVAACALTPEEKQALANAAIIQVQQLNAAGVNPVSLEPEQLALLASGCALAPAFYPEMAADIIATCAVIQEAAQ